ncbi:hypothetical protein L6452_42961 [Arctium lappa]|uniref:Uncharacterized protein n=1 Tax=Arctium lappa TaxID=4217 RepID=A0ACB8XNU8_ARCLA|nr:hypothetical protein L6452_42961 [Arctium lappa]
MSPTDCISRSCGFHSGEQEISSLLPLTKPECSKRSIYQSSSSNSILDSETPAGAKPPYLSLSLSPPPSNFLISTGEYSGRIYYLIYRLHHLPYSNCC